MSRGSRLAVSMSFVAGIFAAGRAAAQPTAPAAPAPAAPAPEGKLYFRGTAGLDVLRMSYERDGFDQALVGRSLGFSLAAGGKIGPHVRLYLEYFQHGAAEGNHEFEGMSGGDFSPAPSHRGLGAGGSYYWANGSYVGGTVGAGRVLWVYETMDAPDRETDFGPHVAVRVGQDFTSTGSWSLGAAAEVAVDLLSEERFGITDDYVLRTVSLQLAVTYH